MYVFAQNCSLLRSNCRGVEDAAPYDETHRFPPIKAFCYSPFVVADCYIFSGAWTPMMPREMAMTRRTQSASRSRASSTPLSAPLMRQTV